MTNALPQAGGSRDAEGKDARLRTIDVYIDSQRKKPGATAPDPATFFDIFQGMTDRISASATRH